MAFIQIAAEPESIEGASLDGLGGAYVRGRRKGSRRCYSWKTGRYTRKRNCSPSRRTRRGGKRRGRSVRIGAFKRSYKGGRRPTFRSIKGVGRRCVKILASGKWKFMKAAACGGKSAARKGKKGRKRSYGGWGKPRWARVGKAGRRCVVTNKRTGRRSFVKSSRCTGKRRPGLRGLSGLALGPLGAVSPTVAVMAETGDLDEMGTDLAGRRKGRRAKSHCTAVKRGKGGYCACAHRGGGKGKKGAFSAKCHAKGLKVRRAPRRGSFRGYEPADQEFEMGDQGLQGATASLPRSCKRFTTIHSAALGRDIQVCADLSNDPADGSLGYYGGMGYGLGFDIMSVARPAVGVAIGGVVAALLTRFGGKIPGLNRVPWGGVGLAGLASMAAALFGPAQFRGQAAGAFTGVAAVAAYKLLSGEGPPSFLAGYGDYGGLGAIVPELGAIVPEQLSGAGGVDVLAGDGDGVDVLSGAFGSLPFAGAH